jgi:hypothetical protein
MKSPGAMKPKNVRARLVTHTGKGSQQELLPSRHALNKISGGDPMRRTMGDYAKAGPDIAENGPGIMGPGVDENI